MPEKPYKLSYPQLGNYDIAIRYFVNNGLHLDYVAPPSMTKRTIDLGAKYSPDFVCAPFKCMMGCYIEALEKGANVLIQTGGTCRLGYYGELHEQILRDAGYDFEMFNLTLYQYKDLIAMLKGMKKFAPDASLFQMARALPATAKMISVIDKVEDYYRQNMGFETEKGSYDKVYNRFLAQLRQAKKLKDVNRIYKNAMNDFKAIPLNKPEHPLRVGVVGEYFTIMDPYSNHEIEKKIAQMGAEVHRWMNLSNSVMICPDDNTLKKLKAYLHYDLYKFPSSIWVDIQKKLSSRYAKFDTGSSSISTISLAEHYAKKGFDGIVHVKSFGCTPEMDAVPILHNISADYKVPMLFLNYDTQTSDTGIETRLEAFYDMIAMRKEVTQS
jgi:predicted nucleotide-binding protein (sugar kinase/HSP70/actin superfamily)